MKTANHAAAGATSAEDGREIVSTRVFASPRSVVWRAWTEPAHLSRWWGPKGFTNTFHEFDLRSGGDWRFVMHGPDGTDYKNHSIFREIAPPERLVFDHISGHVFQVVATFEEVDAARTKVVFRMIHETAEACARIRDIAVPSNEENFDRLEAELKSMV